jgi:hypothetical protein
LVIDTAANLGDTGFNLGSVNTAVKYAIASDTGAIYYDADGNWATNSVKIGSIGTGTNVDTADVQVAGTAAVAGSITYSVATISAADLKEADDAVSGFIDASSITSITASSIAQAKQVLVTNNGTTGDTVEHATDVAVTLSGETTASDAVDLVAIANATTGKVTASAITTITTATQAEALQLLVTDRLSFISNPAVAVTLSSTTVNAANLNSINGATTTDVVISAATTLTGSVADVATFYAASGDFTSIDADMEITLDAGTTTMTALTGVIGNTTGFVNASAITGITAASVSDAKAVLSTNSASSGDGKVSHATNVAVTLTGTTASDAADLVLIADATTGVVNASTIATITTSTVAEAKQLLSTDSATFTHNPAVAFTTISDSGSAADVDLILGATTSDVTVSVTAGTAAALNSALTNATATDALTLTASAGVVDISDMTALNGKTSVDVVASAVTGVTDTTAVNVINLTTAGIDWDTQALTITGGAGADAITLRAADAGQETLVFGSTAAGNGVDTITNFTLASGKDILDFSAWTTKDVLGGSGAAVSTIGLTIAGSLNFSTNAATIVTLTDKTTLATTDFAATADATHIKLSASYPSGVTRSSIIPK